MVKTLTLVTEKKEELINITSIISGIIGKEKIADGMITVYIPHTTAGIIINEYADPDLASDIDKFLKKIVPETGNYKHSEGNSPAHIKAVLTGSSVNIPVVDGKLLLGTWQGVFFCEFDGPRNRSVHIIL